MHAIIVAAIELERARDAVGEDGEPLALGELIGNALHRGTGGKQDGGAIRNHAGGQEADGVLARDISGLAHRNVGLVRLERDGAAMRLSQLALFGEGQQITANGLARHIERALDFSDRDRPMRLHQCENVVLALLRKHMGLLAT